MLGVVVPCFNEEALLADLVKEFDLIKKDLNFDLIFVNDGSTDKTRSIIEDLALERSWIKVVTHKTNQGIAQSLKDGFEYALKEGYSHIAQMDSDLTHQPTKLKDMMREIQSVDRVIASRYSPGGGMKNVPGWRILISRFGNFLFRLGLRIETRDATSGFRLGKKEVYERVKLEENSFGVQLELTVKAERLGFKLKEIPFVLANRERGESKFKLRYLMGYPLLMLKLMFENSNQRS
jgi:dolichol-phosphate mannosyltransferase